MMRKKHNVALVTISLALAVLYWTVMHVESPHMHSGNREMRRTSASDWEILTFSLDEQEIHASIRDTMFSSDEQKIYASTSSIGDAKKDLQSSYLMKYQPHHFVIQNNFTLPMPRLTLPIYDLITRKWMEELQNYLYQIPPHSTSSPISIVACDSKFKDVLLNWLISAMVKTQQPLLSHVLILSLDQPLHSMLAGHGFDSILVEPCELLASSILQKVEASHRKGFYVVMVLRLTVMRLMNHWGYDVANYDTDAIILRNPERLYYDDFSSSDLIGSRGKFPTSVRNVFGLTLCAGVFMVKSTPEIERFWDIVSKVGIKNPDDQERLNIALTKMKLVWDNTTAITDNKHWTASNHEGFAVTVLDLMHVCRKNCIRKKISSYYVWHHGGKFSEGKIQRARSDHVWLLRKNWEQVAHNSTAKRDKWLRQMRN